MNHKKMTLDTERKSFESIIAMQGDNKSRYIDATIVNRSIPVDLTGCTVKFSAIKPDITDIFNDAVISDAKGGKVKIELTNQTLAVPGVIQATLVILKEDMQLSVLPFFITVIENPYNPNAIESKSEYKALNNALTTAEGYAKELQDASVNLEEKYTTRLNNFDEQLDNIETKKANQSAFNNLKNQVNNLVLESGGDSNLEVVQSRTSNGFSFKTLSSRLDNYESIIKEGKFEIEFYDLVNKSVTDGEPSTTSSIRITTTSKYDISSLNELHLRINKISNKTMTFVNYYYDINETLISTVTSIRSETDSYYDYKIDVTTAHYVRFLFKFSDDSEITENDVYENISLYFYTDDRISKLYDELDNMCYDSLGNKFNTPSEIIKDISSIVSYNNNIFDKTSPDNVDGYINGGMGGIDTSTSYKTSYFITLPRGKKYIISPKIRKFLAYDENKNAIPSTYVDAAKDNFVFTMDNSWGFIRFTCYSGDFENIMLSPGEKPLAYVEHGLAFGKDVGFNDYQKEEIKEIVGSQGNKFENKILFNFGDSIAAGDGNNGKGYAELFATKYNMICYDFAVGGATLGETASNNITTQVTTALSRGITPDYILIEGGTNDISDDGVPIGQIASDYNISNFDKTTTVGALEWIISTLKSNFPSAKMAFVSVHRMGSRGYSSQIERQGACVDTCKKWSVPIIDVFNRGNLNTFLGEYHKFTNPTESQPNGDRTHPNQLGYDTFYLPLIYETLYFI